MSRKIQIESIMPFNEHIEIDVEGSAEYVENELDYETGTGVEAYWSTYVSAIKLCIGSKILIIDRTGAYTPFFNNLDNLIQDYLDEQGY
jgi:hypothetical protein